jgi:hypothetical protein
MRKSRLDNYLIPIAKTSRLMHVAYNSNPLGKMKTMKFCQKVEITNLK